MELKLNIYNSTHEIVKQYTSDTAFIPMGVVEDLMNLIDVNKFVIGSDTELAVEVLKLVTTGFGSIKELLKWSFVGLTDDDLRYVNTVEVVAVIVNILKTTIKELSQLTKSKN